MLDCFVEDKQGACPISVLTPQDFDLWLNQQNAFSQAWLKSSGVQAEAGLVRLIPDEQGRLSRVLCCIADKKSTASVGHLPFVLPQGNYYFDQAQAFYTDYAIAWGLGAYQFTRYKKSKRPAAKLFLDKEQEYVGNMVESTYLVRDLINTATDDMGPSELSLVTKELAQEFGAEFKEIVGNDLLAENYACIHTVGRACDDAPRLLSFTYGDANHPKVTLVGKGVCFDTGGLDIKPSSGMLLMKKDMGGAANVLGLARMIMQAKLPIRLRVLIPAVENSISGNAYRPGDVIKSRQGLSIEIGNTDAEGRLVLADAITEAVSEEPALLIDLATLTGAARIALGTDLPALFSNQAALAQDIVKCGEQTQDPCWPMPLFAPYRESLNSTIADINNAGADSYGGAITAALFLKEFVPDHIPWVHVDMMAWNLRTRPAKPQGGEAMVIRAIFTYLQTHFQ